jgi:hypothetical protein
MHNFKLLSSFAIFPQKNKRERERERENVMRLIFDGKVYNLLKFKEACIKNKLH